MALVLYNAYDAALTLAEGEEIPVLLVGGQQLASYAHNAMQRALVALPGRHIAFVRDAITPDQIRSQRPSYINAILVQSRGRQPPAPCTACAAVRPGLRPFPQCRRVRGYFDGACANCKWRDHASRCSVRDEEYGEEEGDAPSPPPYEDDRVRRRSRSPPPPSANRRAALPSTAILLLGNSSSSPIVLD